MAKGKLAAFESYANKIDSHTRHIGLGRSIIVSIGWIQRRKLDDYPAIKAEEIAAGVEKHLRNSVLEDIEVDYYEDYTVRILTFTVRRAPDDD